MSADKAVRASRRCAAPNCGDIVIRALARAALEWKQQRSTNNTAAPAAQLARRNADLEQLAAGWEALASQTGIPMLQSIWARTCAETLAESARLHVLYAGTARNPVAIAPLVEGAGTPSRLELLGVRELFEPMDFLYADRTALDAIAAAVAATGAPLCLGRVPADSPVIDALRKAYRGRGWVRVTPAPSCPYIALNDEWRDPAGRFDPGRRSDFRRARRRAEQIGALTFEVREPAPSESKELLDEAYDVESAGWKGVSGTALVIDPVRGLFFRRYAEAACRKQLLRLCFLRIAGKAVAMQIALECGGRFYLLKIGYDERYRRCSPGTLLMLHTVAYAAARGLRTYEFLGNEANWTRQWTQETHPTLSLRAYPFSWRGAAALADDARRYCRHRVTGGNR
jgi:CelD/BcsL family acetyltransferase involved in cellulose biosynthesis